MCAQNIRRMVESRPGPEQKHDQRQDGRLKANHIQHVHKLRDRRLENHFANRQNKDHSEWSPV